MTGPPRARSVPILMYHQVTPRPLPAFRRYVVTARAFAAQMGWLVWAGYVPITLDRLLEHRSARSPIPTRPVVITFDDGFQDSVDHAVPIMRARGFTAIFYLVADRMGKGSTWMVPELGFELPLMDWRTARELEAGGLCCGSHGLGHRRLADLTLESCRGELVESRRRLEDELGHEVRHLAYPFGSFDERVRALAGDAGYRSACSTRKGLSPPDDDPLALHRVTVYGEESLIDFACRLRTGRTARELWLRRTQDVRQRLRRAAGRALS